TTSPGLLTFSPALQTESADKMSAPWNWKPPLMFPARAKGTPGWPISEFFARYPSPMASTPLLISSLTATAPIRLLIAKLRQILPNHLFQLRTFLELLVQLFRQTCHFS